MDSPDLQDTISFQISLQTCALLRTGYDVVFNAGKIIHAGCHLFGPSLTRREYALGVILYSVILLITSSIACLAIIWRDSKWLYRVLPVLFLTEMVFIANCFVHDYIACTKPDSLYSNLPPCAFSVMASLIHAGLGVFGLSKIWTYASRLEEREMSSPITVKSRVSY